MDSRALIPFWDNNEIVVCEEVIEKAGSFRPVVFRPEELLNHMYISGKSGSGKSTFAANIALSLAGLRDNQGWCYIDPHGDAAEYILDNIPEHRLKDVIYFNPADTNHPAAFNILSGKDAAAHEVADAVTESFRALYSKGWGVTMQELTFNTTGALVEYGQKTGGATLLYIPRMLRDEAFRREVVNKVSNPVIRRYWTDTFPQRIEDFKSTYTSPVENKIVPLLAIPTLLRILGQIKSTIKPQYFMDNRKILICNLSSGKIGVKASSLLGGLLVNAFSMAAKKRSWLPAAERTPFTLLIDEFPSISTDSLGAILSEARKYGLGLVLCNQYLHQMEFDIKQAIFGNVATHVAFRMGGADAEHYEREYHGEVIANQFTNLSRFEVFIKREVASLERGGEVDENPAPFRALTLPPIRMHNAAERFQVVNMSRRLTTRKREEVDKKISRFL